MAYYLKYRPQRISDLDNENVREILSSTLAAKEMQHSFLLTGPKGLGKTSSARIIAKTINCKDKVKGSVEPCNKCEMCVSITQGTNMDVIEIDAASNRGIDEIRDLREKVRLSPGMANKKVYIIDEVHMLTTEAFNALLKTLEEPPKHAIFILATTEPHKVPETIISRCLHVSFHRATDQEIVHSLERIVKGENLKIDENVVYEIAKLSDGGFRDGAKILEELASLANGKKIDNILLEKRFQTKAVSSAAFTLLEFFAKRETQKGLVFAGKLGQEGIDFSYLLSQVINNLHDVLLFKAGAVSDRNLEKLASLFSLSEISLLFSILTKAQSGTKYAVIPELSLELALIEWEEVTKLQESELLNPVLQKEPESGVSTEDILTINVLKKQAGNMAKKQLSQNGTQKKKSSEKKIEVSNNRNLLAFKSEGEVTQEWLSEFWQEIIQRMKEHNHTLAGVMRGCRIKSFDRKILVIETKFTFHKDRLGEQKTIKTLEEICTSITGKNISVSIELVNK